MNRQEKDTIIQSVKEKFRDSKSSFIVGVQGMTVSAVQELRKNLRSKGGSLRVAKNTLLKLAVQGSPIENLVPYFKDQIAVVFVKDDIAGVAKILNKVSKDNEKLTLIVGTIDETIIDKSKISLLASLPAENVIKAQLCSALKGPMFRFVNVLNQVQSRLVVVINKVAEKRKENQ